MRSSALLPWLLLVAACHRPGRPDVTIAAAANLSSVFQIVGPKFESASGIHPVFSFGSTAALTQQIENSAPYDVIAAADSEHIVQLDKRGLLLPGSLSVYATGILVLWIPPRSRAMTSRIEDLALPDVQAIAVAKPELAPYGQAAVDTLRQVGIWEKVKSKIVYAANISMAKQYGASNNADAVFTAYSLVQKSGGKLIAVDEKLHQPITQMLAIVAASKHQDAARKFVAFLLTGEGRDILSKSGYRVPSHPKRY